MHRQLRCEVSAGQLAVLSARAELSATQEELRATRAVSDTEKFPDLLLSSLDKLFEDKQQQLWLVSWAVARNVNRNVLHTLNPTRPDLHKITSQN